MWRGPYLLIALVLFVLAILFGTVGDTYYSTRQGSAAANVNAALTGGLAVAGGVSLIADVISRRAVAKLDAPSIDCVTAYQRNAHNAVSSPASNLAGVV